MGKTTKAERLEAKTELYQTLAQAFTKIANKYSGQPPTSSVSPLQPILPRTAPPLVPQTQNKAIPKSRNRRTITQLEIDKLLDDPQRYEEERLKRLQQKHKQKLQRRLQRLQPDDQQTEDNLQRQRQTFKDSMPMEIADTDIDEEDESISEERKELPEKKNSRNMVKKSTAETTKQKPSQKQGRRSDPPKYVKHGHSAEVSTEKRARSDNEDRHQERKKPVNLKKTTPTKLDKKIQELAEEKTSKEIALESTTARAGTEIEKAVQEEEYYANDFKEDSEAEYDRNVMD